MTPENEQTVAPHTGDEVILSPNGRPWPNVKDADRALKASNRDPEKFGTLAYEGGFAIAPLRKILAMRDSQMAAAASEVEQSRTPPPMKFHRIKIHPRTSDNESNTVLLGFNNNVVVVTRGMEVILDEPHMEVLRNASSEDLQAVDAVTQQRNPERALKAGHSLVYRFPFTVLGDASQAEFEAFISKMHGATERALQNEQLKAVGGTA